MVYSRKTLAVAVLCLASTITPFSADASSSKAGTYAVIGEKQSGDTVMEGDGHYAEIGTDQCAGADDVNIGTGGPYPNPEDITTYLSTSHKHCLAYARIVYVTTRGKLGSTSWVKGSGKGGGGYVTKKNVFRCYTEFNLRRKDGSYFSLHMYSGYFGEPKLKHCPSS